MNKRELELATDDTTPSVVDTAENSEMEQSSPVDAPSAQEQRELHLRKGEELIHSLL